MRQKCAGARGISADQKNEYLLLARLIQRKLRRGASVSGRGLRQTFVPTVPKVPIASAPNLRGSSGQTLFPPPRREGGLRRGIGRLEQLAFDEPRPEHVEGNVLSPIVYEAYSSDSHSVAVFPSHG